jgi:hypothetical protein
VSRIEWLLFLSALFGYAYFHQGGGWSQNARFAEVRAIVEQRRLAVDSYLIYAAPEGRLARLPVTNASYRLHDQTYTLAWSDPQGTLVPMTEPRAGEGNLVAVHQVAASGDLSFFGGHFHPNKAPGTAFLAVPAYALLFSVEHAAGLDPDDWWILTLNAWLTSVFSVGIVSALGCVLFYRLAANLSEGRVRPALLATITFAAATLYLPYGTMLYEHNIVAVALLASFYWLYQFKRTLHWTSGQSWRDFRLVLAGLAAGYSALTNYLAAAVVIFLGIYLLSFTRKLRDVAAYSLGVAVPFLGLCAYHQACFGSPFVTGYQHQSPLFHAERASFLGVFGAPQPKVLLTILFSPFRGLFFSSPVLLMGIVGWFHLLRDGRHRGEAWLFASIVAFFVLFNCCFNGWSGGWGVGPRYLVPALPFLALPLVFAFEHFSRTTAVLAVLSGLLMFVTTAVDPQCPLAGTPIAFAGDRPLWRYSPLTEYEIPLLLTGRPGPFLRAQADGMMERFRREIEGAGLPPEAKAQRLAAARADLDTALARGDSRLFPLAFVQGPVSADPQGLYEGAYFRVFPPGEPQNRWNSFNVGEFLFPGSRLSLVPWVLGMCLLVFWTWRSPNIELPKSVAP